MPIPENKKEKIRFIYQFHKLYWSKEAGWCSKEEFQNLEGNWIDALLYFIDRYAFERQGADSRYKYEASEILKNTFDLNDHINNQVKKRVYNNFRKAFDKPNEKNCPLDPKSSILTLCQEVEGKNLVTFTKSCLENNEISQAYNRLKKVKGIGPKIASFWIRDVADGLSIDTDNLDDRELLQPIDTWVYQFLKALSPSIGKLKSTKEFLFKAGRNMTQVARECDLERPTYLNTAAFTFGNQILSEWGYDYLEIMTNDQEFEKLKAEIHQNRELDIEQTKKWWEIVDDEIIGN